MVATCKKPTPTQAVETMRWVCQKTHEVLSDVISYNYTGTSSDPGRDPVALSGKCGLAQSYIHWTLAAKHIVSKPVALQTLPGEASFRHVALTVEVDTTEGKKRFLLDKTYAQFCTGKLGEPGEVLSRSTEGKAIVDALCTEGFIELTPLQASRYLAAFNGGKSPFQNQDQAMQFFTEPRPSKMNLWYSQKRLKSWGYVA